MASKYYNSASSRTSGTISSRVVTSTTNWRIFLVVLSSFLIGTQINCSFSGSLLLDGSSLWGEGQEPQQQQVAATTTFDLAFEQSYGFFDTISNDEWKMKQDWARNATHHRYLGHPRRLWEKAPLWYYNNYDPVFSCPLVKRVKGVGDGPKWTCDPHRLIHVVERRKRKRQHTAALLFEEEKNNNKKKKKDEEEKEEDDCLIYSIGSNGNYQWEDGMVHLIGTICEIHIFDYSQNYTRNKNQRQNMYFHQWGLKGSSQQQQQNRGGIFYTFFEIIQRLGHINRTIDIFKIDCEGCEWSTFHDWINYEPIRQVLIETHKLPKNKTKGLEFFDSFEQNNLIMFSKEVNPWGGGDSLEFSYIKLHPDFLNI